MINYKQLLIFFTVIVFFSLSPNIINDNVAFAVISFYQASTINDGDEYTELNDPRDIATAVIDGDTFAFVMSYTDEGIQIVNISDPSNPHPVYAIDNTDTGYDTLDNPVDIKTIVIDGDTFALVANYIGKSVHIINVTNPYTPTLTAEITNDDLGGILDRAHAVETVTINDKIFLLVAGFVSDNILSFDISDPANPVLIDEIRESEDPNNLELDGPVNIESIVIGDTTYALVVGQQDDGVQITSVSSSGIITPVGIIDFDDNPLADKSGLDNLRGLTTVFVDDTPYAIFTSYARGVVQITDISDPTTPQYVTFVSDLNTIYPYGITTVLIDDIPYVLVASQWEVNNVAVFDIIDPYNPSDVFSMDYWPDRGITGPFDLTTVEILGKTYALVAGYQYDNVEMIQMYSDDLEIISGVIDLKIGDETITITDENSILFEINYYANVTNPTLDYSSLMINEKITTNRELTVNLTNSTGGDVSVLFNAETAINGTGFTGIIKLPTDLGESCTGITPVNDKSIISCIFIGQEDTPLSVNPPTRISLSGQTGNVPWFADIDTATPIILPCTGDDITNATLQLINSNECYFDNGSDVIIWTSHFTTFGSNLPITIPDAPTSLNATAGDTQVTLNWIAPTDDGGSPITDYLIEYNDGTNGWQTFADGTSTVTSTTVTSLVNSQSYDFRVSAINSIGTSVPSTTVTATPITTPEPSPGGGSSGETKPPIFSTSNSGGGNRINVSLESKDTMKIISSWVADKKYFKTGVNELIIRGTIDIEKSDVSLPPEWFYKVGKLWNEGKITNQEYFEALEYLLNN